MAEQNSNKLSLGNLTKIFEGMIEKKSEALLARFSERLDAQLAEFGSAAAAGDAEAELGALQRDLEEMRLKNHLAFSHIEKVDSELASLKADIERIDQVLSKIKAELNMDRLKTCPECGSAVKYYIVDVGEFGKCDVCGWDHVLELDL